MTSLITVLALTVVLAAALIWARRDRFASAPRSAAAPIAASWVRPSAPRERAARRHAVRHSQPA
ncbi:MAG TPA: hypothetical protein VNS46_13535 [Nocardioides sp.]|nr:hypothetical protein [Nocardioides sp.]